jgi:hypothetical protein
MWRLWGADASYRQALLEAADDCRQYDGADAQRHHCTMPERLPIHQSNPATHPSAATQARKTNNTPKK